jgi:hypothetical protein
MLTALGGEKAPFQSFVFKLLTALGICAVVGPKVTMRFVGSKASWWEVTLGRCGIIISFLLRPPGGEVKDRVKSSAPY